MLLWPSEELVIIFIIIIRGAFEIEDFQNLIVSMGYVCYLLGHTRMHSIDYLLV